MLTITQVDAFTSEPFGGNPAAVCLLPAPADEAWMQRVAREMNLSETAFLVSVATARSTCAGSRRQWRWTCAATRRWRVLTCCGRRIIGPGRAGFFHTVRPIVAILREWIEMDFPAEPDQPASFPTAWSTPSGPIRSMWGETASTTSWKLTRRRQCDGSRLTSGSETLLPPEASSSPRWPRPIGIDFVSRYFAPSAGIDEDPVTGSTHCSLAP